MSHYDPNACDDYNGVTRRQFMGVSAGTLGAASLAASLPSWFPTVVFAEDCDCPDHTFVFIHLFGGPDSLSMVPPYGDPRLHGTADPLRPVGGPLGVPAPGDGTPQDPEMSDLDGYFGLAPALYRLRPAWDDGGLAIAVSSVLEGQSYSHFTATRWMGLMQPDPPQSAFDGFMAKHLQTIAGCGSVLRGMTVAPALQPTMIGAPSTLPVPDPTDFGLTGPADPGDARLTALDTMYQLQNKLPLWEQVSAATIETINHLAQLDLGNYVPVDPPDPNDTYTTSSLGKALKAIAGMIKGDAGLEMAGITYGGWDTHNNQQNNIPGGNMWNRMDTLSRDLGAFYYDMVNDPGPTKNFTLFVTGEFGRTAFANDTDPMTAGTDHGHGGVQFILGNKINGGQIINGGLWPGLAQLHRSNKTCSPQWSNDVCQVTDPRDMLIEIFDRLQCNYSNLGLLFPDYPLTPPDYLGIVKA